MHDDAGILMHDEHLRGLDTCHDRQSIIITAFACRRHGSRVALDLCDPACTGES